MSRLQDAIIQLSAFFTHLPSCKIDTTDFCTCGLRDAKCEFNEALHEKDVKLVERF